MVAALEVGAEVVTNGGILGKVTELGEQYLTLEIADGVQVKVQRHTISAGPAERHAQERLIAAHVTSWICNAFHVLSSRARLESIGWSSSDSSCDWSSASLFARLPSICSAMKPAMQLARERPGGDGRGGAAAGLGRARGAEDRADGLVSRRRPAGPALRACRRTRSGRATPSPKRQPGEYIVALTSVPRTPAWLRKLGLKPMSLGLDLRGGVHFMYEVDIRGRDRPGAAANGAGHSHAAARGAHSVQRRVASRDRLVRVTLRRRADRRRPHARPSRPNDPGITISNETAGEGRRSSSIAL